jgi:hypothetical protein
MLIDVTITIDTTMSDHVCMNRGLACMTYIDVNRTVIKDLIDSTASFSAEPSRDFIKDPNGLIVGKAKVMIVDAGKGPHNLDNH